MDHKEKTYIISKFIGNKIGNNGSRWSQEINILNRLIKKGYCDLEFWENLVLDYEFYSFSHFLKDNCKAIHFKYLEYLKRVQAIKVFHAKIKYNL